MALFVLGVACKAPVEAPADLGDASVYAYANYGSPSGDELQAATDSIEAYLLSIDLNGAVNDRTVAPPKLLPENWGGVTGPADADPLMQVPVAVAGRGLHPIADYIQLVGEPNYICVESDTTKYAARTFTTPLDCFLDGTCDQVSTTQETRKESTLAKVWYDYYKDYRVVELRDGRQAMYSRGWSDRVWATDGSAGTWDQSYQLDVWIEDAADPSGTLRYQVLWTSVTLAGLGDDLWGALVKNGIADSFESVDAFLDGESCSNDRDRPYDRPQ